MAILPAIFLGHGNPMNALLHNAYTEGWATIGDKIPRPQAVLCISAHWYVTSAAVTVNTAPARSTTSADFHESCMK
jgi:4,5-DOPA dioxygenase extradiol